MQECVVLCVHKCTQNKRQSAISWVYQLCPAHRALAYKDQVITGSQRNARDGAFQLCCACVRVCVRVRVNRI